MFQNMKRAAAIAAVAMATTAPATSAFASVVFSVGTITSEADVLNGGTVVQANHFGTPGGSPAVPVTVNGILFGTSTAGLSGMLASGSDFANQFGTGTPLDVLLSGAHFQTGSSSSLTLTGLTAGTNYLLQLLIDNTVNTTGSSSWVDIQGDTLNLTPYFYPSLNQRWNLDAHYVRASFTAAGASQLVSFGNGYTYESDRMHLNAYALSTVPEPGSLALASLALAGLVTVGRRRKA